MMGVPLSEAIPLVTTSCMSRSDQWFARRGYKSEPRTVGVLGSSASTVSSSNSSSGPSPVPLALFMSPLVLALAVLFFFLLVFFAFEPVRRCQGLILDATDTYVSGAHVKEFRGGSTNLERQYLSSPRQTWLARHAPKLNRIGACDATIRCWDQIFDFEAS